jgi:hypothetical protein
MDARFCRFLLLTSLLVAFALLGAVVPARPTTTSAAPAARPNANLAPTYRIFATREGLVGQMTANGHIIRPRDHFVALPSWQVLSSYRGYEFQVRVTYNGRSAVVPVWDVGPWNTNDAYWHPNRGDYPDLPIGMPQAQAAYFDGHNGGMDEFGRLINNPNGIDIADGTYWDSLGMTRNDWVEVSFLWLGEDPGPGAAVQAPIPAPPPANPPAGPPAAPAPPQPAPDPGPPPPPSDNPQIPAGATAVDNSDTTYSSREIEQQSFACGLNGDHAWVRGASSNNQQAIWTPDLPSGAYEVSAYIPPCGEVAASSAARYTVSHDGGASEVIINQATAEGTWVSLGAYHFGLQGVPSVELHTVSSDVGGAVRFDAIAWQPVPDITPPTASLARIQHERNGFRVTWRGEDDLSGVGGYDVQVRQLPKGGWRYWVRDKDLTDAWFGPHEGRNFAFRVRARDLSGNEQAAWSEELHTTEAVPEPEE